MLFGIKLRTYTKIDLLWRWLLKTSTTCIRHSVITKIFIFHTKISNQLIIYFFSCTWQLQQQTRQQRKNGASSKLQRLPVAPRGCPLEMSPPLGFITHFPPYVLSPLSTSSPPFPEIINKSLIRVCHAASFYLHMQELVPKKYFCQCLKWFFSEQTK